MISFNNLFLNFRWDFSLIQSLPECMKVVFKTVVELWDEIEMILVETGKSNLVVEYIKQAVCLFQFLYTIPMVLII
jgi:hypothetical protein